MRTHLLRLAAHSTWADARLLRAVQSLSGDATAVLRELGHIRGAQAIWLSRITGAVPLLGVWPTLTPDELAQHGATLDAAWERVLETLTDDALAQHVEYRNLAGAARRTRLGDILLHPFTHGQMHRGKANAALRAMGAEPVGVDYIAWVWEREGAG